MVKQPLDFFAARSRKLRTDDDHQTEAWETENGKGTAKKLAAFVSAAMTRGRLEFWVDPDVNSQIQMMQILNWLRELDGAERVTLVQLQQQLGELTPDEIRNGIFESKTVDGNTCAIASTYWTAFCQSTPRDWAGLFKTDQTAFDFLSRTCHRMLMELPSASNGLTETQSRILHLIRDGFDSPIKLFSHESMRRPEAILGYWQLGKMVVHLGRISTPAIHGLPENEFTLELHDDATRWKRFRSASIALTDFGRALLDGDANFVSGTKIDRWWGGTHLTNANLWRWDGQRELLVAPAS